MKDEKDNIGICRLCQVESLLCQSHIVPEFFYKKIYDRKPKKFYSIWTKGADGKHKKEQKGIRERLLCKSCESQLSKYEKVACEILYAPNNRSKALVENVVSKENMLLFRFKNVDYDFKRFQLSLLWRILISESFRVDFPEKEIVSEELRLAVFQTRNTSFDSYGCVLQEITYPQGNPATGFILNPFINEVSPMLQTLNVLIDGFLFTYFLSSDNIPSFYSKHFLTETGKMSVIKRHIIEDQFLYDALKQTYNYFYKRIKSK
jgi:hypothetical protein